MMLKSLNVAAAALAAASAANAFLIPPELSEIDIEVAEIIEVPVPKTSEKVAIDLECPGCPIYVEGHAGEVVPLKHAHKNHLELSFTVDRTPEGDRLLVNGFELYPSADPFQSLAARQVIDREENEAASDEVRPTRIFPPRLGYSLQVQPVASDADGSLELILVDLQIIEVGEVFISDIPNIQVKVIKSPGSGLKIGSIETTESRAPPMNAPADGQECTTLMCRWIAFAQDKFRQMKNHMKPCHGKNGKGMMHHGHHGHGHHGHHGQNPPQAAGDRHTFGKLLKNIASHILLPVFIGVVAGVSASLIGMVVGTLAVSLWRTFFRRPSDRAAVKEDASVEEKSGLIEHQDPPPAYEAEDDVKKPVV